MRTEKELILATTPYAKEQKGKSWFHLLSTLAVLIFGYVIIFSDVKLGWKIAASLLLSGTIVRMFIIYHDYLHRSILQKSAIAKAWFTVFGMYILAPTSIWKRSHDYHHQHNSKLYTSSIGSYPVVTKEKFLSATKSEKRLYLFIRHPITIAFGYLFMFILGMCVRSLRSNPKKHWDSALALGLHFTIGTLILVLVGWLPMLLAFAVPALVSSALGAYLFYAQHNFPDVKFADKDGWTYVGAALDSSSYMKGNPVMHWFTGNIGYHHIHHLNHRIPFYRLPEALENIPELQNAKTTSLLPWDVAKCLSLKVWDPEKEKMVGLKELKN